MRGRVEEGHPLAIQLPLLLYLPPEGLIGALQIGEGGIQPPGKLIQAAAQFSNLVPPLLSACPVKVQLRHLPGNPAHAHDGTGNVPGVNEGAQQREHQQHQQKPGGHLNQRPHRLVLHLNPGRDIEGVALPSAGKGHLSGDGGLLHRVAFQNILAATADRRLLFRGRDDHDFILIIYSLNHQLCPRVHQTPVRPHQHGIGPGGQYKLIQQSAAVLLCSVR